MELTWHPATLKDIKLLTKIRIDILRTEHEMKENTDMSDILVQTYEYYKEALTGDAYASYLVFDSEEVIGTGDIRFTRALPTQENPTGREAHLMNLYVHPDYRRQGVAYRTIALLIAEANKRGIHTITLEATEMSRPLFTGFGFAPQQNGMALQNNKDSMELDIPAEEPTAEAVIQSLPEEIKAEKE